MKKLLIITCKHWNCLGIWGPMVSYFIKHGILRMKVQSGTWFTLDKSGDKNKRKSKNTAFT